MNAVLILMCTWLPAAAGQGPLSAELAAVQKVGPEGAGHEEAAAAWPKLAAAGPESLSVLLAALDEANPLAANWLRTAVDAVAERALADSGRLPVAELEQWVTDRSHGPRSRALAFDWLSRADASAGQRLVPGMLDDACLPLRREAVQRLADAAQAVLDGGDKDQARKLFDQALAAARDLDQVRALAERLGKLGAPIDLARRLGYLVRWQVIGPFDNVDGKGFAAVYPPEQQSDPAATYPGKHGPVKWIAGQGEGRAGDVNFNKLLVMEKGVAAYAAAEFVSDRRQEVDFRLSSANAMKLWLNGRLLGAYPVYHGGEQPDQYVSRGTLEAGRNRILVKVCQNEQTQDWAKIWHFQLRVCDALGAAVLSQDRQ